MPSTQVRELCDQLRIDVAHARDEGEDGGHHLHEAQRADHPLEPRTDLVEESGAKAEVTFSREAIVGSSNGAAGRQIPNRDVFLRGQGRRLPSRPASRACQLDALDNQRELGGLDGDGRQALVAREGRTKAPLLKALVTQDGVRALRAQRRILYG